MVRDVEEHKLIQDIEEAGHKDIAESVLKVLNKRDDFIRRIYNKQSTVHSKQTELCQRIERLSAELETHIENTDKKLDDLIQELHKGFPDGDLPGHKKLHQKWIEREEQRLAFRQAIIDKSLQSLLWSGGVFVAYAVWNYLRQIFQFQS